MYNVKHTEDIQWEVKFCVCVCEREYLLLSDSLHLCSQTHSSSGDLQGTGEWHCRSECWGKPRRRKCIGVWP